MTHHTLSSDSVIFFKCANTQLTREIEIVAYKKENFTGDVFLKGLFVLSLRTLC